MLTKIQFIAAGCSSVLGNFAPGDVARCHAAHARHLVEEARCARYADEPPNSEPHQAASSQPQRARPRKVKEPQP